MKIKTLLHCSIVSLLRKSFNNGTIRSRKRAAIKQWTSGFTLIELLVVIGILGILASALVATIDPFEQLSKATDSSTQNTTVEFVNAAVRYYTTHTKLPWGTSDGLTSCAGSVSLTSANLNAGASPTNMTQCLKDLIAEGELKASFTTATNITKNIVVSGIGDPVTSGAGSIGATACYVPQSKSGQKNQNTRYNEVGAVTTGCKSMTSSGGINCYWCSL